MIDGVQAWDLEGEDVSERVLKLILSGQGAQAELFVANERGFPLWDPARERMSTIIITLSRLEVKGWTEPRKLF